MEGMDATEFVATLQSLAWKGLITVERDVETDELLVTPTAAGYIALQEAQS